MRLLLTMLLLLSASAFAEKKPIYPPGQKPGGNFSPAILSDGTLYVSGQVGRDKDGNYPEKFEDEVKYALDAIADTMKAAGFTFKDAVAVQVYLHVIYINKNYYCRYWRYIVKQNHHSLSIHYLSPQFL